ncbi:hypothetical protein MiSe_66390 [Microseira wollei NIES-4236]|uniref:DUF4058 family protein n=2 Tax=Microseira wollei TaxID=467598 RepID=A0AAV3XIV3_9CYAN|nr:DUF4058 family protein [Microseira wollei]GET41825.1 hypothetical protein MiSe_66390 [Microseira wollei NIES-4236]
MPSPFPGMDPYLEQAVFWSSFHTRLIVAIADTIAPSLRPKYYVEVEARTYLDEADEDVLVGIPDALILSSRANSSVLPEPTASGTIVQPHPVQIILPMPTEIKERYLEVREVGSDAVITVIEVLSPKNKRRGEGRVAYEKKRRQVLGSFSHLVEIDLLRGDLPMTAIGVQTRTDYRIIVSRADRRPVADLYGFGLRDAIPSFPLPLKPEDEELLVDLPTIFHQVCDRSSYDLRIDYRQPVPPTALSEADRQWVDALLAPLRV